VGDDRLVPEGDDSEHSRAGIVPGSRVRLRNGVGGAPAGSEGRVVGYIRREPELVVVSLAGSGLVVDVRHEDLERLLD
jgi:hypothetical protein